jgi:hypothetical protein
MRSSDRCATTATPPIDLEAANKKTQTFSAQHTTAVFAHFEAFFGQISTTETFLNIQMMDNVDILLDSPVDSAFKAILEDAILPVGERALFTLFTPRSGLLCNTLASDNPRKTAFVCFFFVFRLAFG